MRIAVLFVAMLSFVPNAWCRLCRLSIDDDAEAIAKFKLGDLYTINAGKDLRDSEEEEPGFFDKLKWHSWISVTSSADNCIYSFGLAGPLNEPPLNIYTPDYLVNQCHTRLNDCLWATSHGRDYEMAINKKDRLRIPKSKRDAYSIPNDRCRSVCKGINDYLESGPNKDYPVFESWRSGKLNENQVAILQWLIKNTTFASTKGGYRKTTVPFRYSLYCSLPGAQTLDALRPNANVLDVANCQTFAANFDRYSGELLRQLRAYKP